MTACIMHIEIYSVVLNLDNVSWIRQGPEMLSITKRYKENINKYFETDIDGSLYNACDGIP